MMEASLSIGTRKQKVLFRCSTNDHSPVAIAGDVAELGHWNVNGAVTMTPQPRSHGGFEWTTQIELPQGQTVEYKFVKKTAGGIRWESGNNHRITVIPGLQTLDTDFRE